VVQNGKQIIDNFECTGPTGQGRPRGRMPARSVFRITQQGALSQHLDRSHGCKQGSKCEDFDSNHFVMVMVICAAIGERPRNGN
jgi:hypothetical protein